MDATKGSNIMAEKVNGDLKIKIMYKMMLLFQRFALPPSKGSKICNSLIIDILEYQLWDMLLHGNSYFKWVNIYSFIHVIKPDYLLVFSLS